MDKLQLAELQEVETVERESFKIEGKQSAEWALRKIKALKEQIKETDELAGMEIERIKMWQQKENQSAEDSISFFEYLLQDYMTKERELNPKTKSIKLPHGTVRFKKQQPQWNMDEEKTITWLKENYPDKVKVVEKFSKTDVKKIIKETGEIFDGLEIVEREDKFEVVVD